MKLLSIVIPSFNSEKYILRCLNSLLVGRDDELDVIVVNDGSTDNTLKIACEFALEHPFVRVIDKANAGHGSGINVGLKYAEGLYFKLLDSDDLLDKEGLLHLLDVIRTQHAKEEDPDIYLADYIRYFDGTDKIQGITSYHDVKKYEQVITWKDFPKMRFGDFFMIHSFYVKTELAKHLDCPLLEHTFYEDNQFVFYVIKKTQTLYHLNKPIYRYTLGREGQSITSSTMGKRYEHQHRVMRSMIDHISIDEYNAMDKYHQNHIRHELLKISILVFHFTQTDKGKERRIKYKELYKYFKQSNPDMYRLWKYKTQSIIMWGLLPCFRRTFTNVGYVLKAKKKGW